MQDLCQGLCDISCPLTPVPKLSDADVKLFDLLVVVVEVKTFLWHMQEDLESFR